MNTKRRRNCAWFVEPLDAETNRVISGYVEDAEEHPQIVCADGIRRDMWECPHYFIGKLSHSIQSLGLRFKVFRRQGLHGKIHEWKFGVGARVKKESEVI